MIEQWFALEESEKDPGAGIRNAIRICVVVYVVLAFLAWWAWVVFS